MPSVNHYGLAINVPFVSASSVCYRPPSWPPPRDWACIVDQDGKVVSRWGDPIWYLHPWAGRRLILNFGDGAQCRGCTPIDENNADVLRLLITWRGWGPHGARTPVSLKNYFTTMRGIVALCSREGILASDLIRFPAIVAKLPEVIPKSTFHTVIAELQRIIDARHDLGFILLDQSGLCKLSAAKPEHFNAQTEYIPPRIWTYQVNRLRECLDDYLAHQQKIEDCFNFCINAYAQNFGTLTNALINNGRHSKQPFQDQQNRHGIISGHQFHGHFLHTAVQFGIFDLLGRWVEEPSQNLSNSGISRFSSYLSLIQEVGLAYTLNFSLMRQQEGRGLRADCLNYEEDEKLGKIPILFGQTTKTDPDSDARWPTSPSVKVAIDAATSVSRLRMLCAQANPIVAPTAEDVANPFLFDRCHEPWSGGVSQPYCVRQYKKNYSDVITRYPKLFASSAVEITEEDLCIARAITSTLDQELFQVGKKWLFSYHQLRRTGAVNMASSGIVSDSTTQFQMKHLTRSMSLYYGRGSSKLSLNEEARTVLVNAQYQVMAREIAAVRSDRFVSPCGEEHKKKMLMDSQESLQEGEVNILSEKDAKRLEAAARRGGISFRRTTLGGCMSNGQCEGDCIESIADCAGGDSAGPCEHALFDRQRVEQNRNVLAGVKRRLASTPPGTPCFKALEKEKRGLENYFVYINETP